jgi:hypothetical protein
MGGSSDEAKIYRRWTWVFIGLIVAGCLVGIAVPAGLGWDFANFYDAGRRIAAGQVGDLYAPASSIAGQPPQGSTGFFGAPLSALFYVPLAAFSARTALVLFKIQNALAFAAIFILLLRFYRPFLSGPPLEHFRFTALFAFLFLIYQPFWTIFRVGGQTTPTVLLMLSLGLVAHTNGRFWASALCVVIAALIKPSLAPAVVFLACISELAFVWRMAALWTGAGALSLLLLGWPVHVSFVNQMLESLQWEYSWYFNSSIYVPLDILRAHVHQAIFLILTYALKAAVVVTFVWFAWQARRRPWTAAARRHLCFLLMMAFYLVWSPTVFEHYLSLLFPLLIFIVASSTSFSREALTLVAAIFFFSIGQNLILINWIRYGFEIDSLPELLCVSLFKGAPLLLTMVLLWRHGTELLRSHTAPAWSRYEPAARQEPV